MGAWGDAAAFSFYPTKNMMSGEGGMIVVHDPEVERTCRLLRNQGMERRYANEIVGYNLRMTDLHAAIGRAQFGQLCEWTVARQANAAHLSANLRGVITPPVAAEANHVYHQYTVRVEEATATTSPQLLRLVELDAASTTRRRCIDSRHSTPTSISRRPNEPRLSAFRFPCIRP